MKMISKVEGLILQKIPFKERDLIGKILLRNGKTLSVIFHGGRGGGTKKKSSVLEIGHLISIEIFYKRSNEQQTLYRAKEWKLIWAPKVIRTNYRAFFLMSFYLEVMLKVSLPMDLHASDSDEYDSTFRVASNALFYLEDSLGQNSFQKGSQRLMFLTKLVFELGIAPNLLHCLLCEQELSSSRYLYLKAEHGGFFCADCAKDDLSLNEGVLGKELHFQLGKIHQLKYSQYDQLTPIQDGALDNLFHYFCYQFQFNRQDFKSMAGLD